jgi:hypothetical protein
MTTADEELTRMDEALKLFESLTELCQREFLSEVQASHPDLYEQCHRLTPVDHGRTGVKGGLPI